MERNVYDFCQKFGYASIKIVRHGDCDTYSVTLTFRPKLRDKAIKMLIFKYINFVSDPCISLRTIDGETEIKLLFNFELPF